MAEFTAPNGGYCMCTREHCTDECKTYRAYRSIKPTPSICDDCSDQKCLWRTPTGVMPPVMGCPDFAQKPITNYDRIVSKTPKELAEYLAPCACPPIRFNKNTGDIVCPVNKEPSESNCKSCWIDWLKQEAE